MKALQQIRKQNKRGMKKELTILIKLAILNVVKIFKTLKILKFIKQRKVCVEIGVT